MTRFEKEVVAFTSMTHGLVHMLELSYGALLASIASEFGASLFVMGVLANIMGLFYGVTALPAGLISDRRRERHLLTACCLGMGAASIAIGLSPGIPVLAAGLLALGMALGIYHPTGAAFISRTVARRGLGFGIQGVGGNIGMALGPVTASTIAAFLGWRAAYLILALPPILLGLLIFFLLRSEAPSTAGPAIAPVKTGNSPWRPLVLPVVLIFATTIFNGFVYRAFVTFLPVYLSERVHLTLFSTVLVAGSFATIALMFGVAGQFVGGFLSERVSREGLAFTFLLTTAALLVVIGNSSGTLLIAATAVFAFFHFLGQPVGNMLLADYSPARWQGRLFGMYYACSYGVGSFSAGVLGYAGTELGLGWVFNISAGSALLGMLCIVCLWTQARGIKARILEAV